MNILLRPFLLLALGFLVMEELHGQCPWPIQQTSTAIDSCPNDLVQVTGFVPRGDGLLRTQIWRGTDAVSNAAVQDIFTSAFDSLDADGLPIHRQAPSVTLVWPMVGINYLPNSPTVSSAIQYNWPACDPPNCTGIANDNYAQGVEQAQQDGWLLIPDSLTCIQFSFSASSNQAAALYLSKNGTVDSLRSVLELLPPGNTTVTANWDVPLGLPGATTGFRYTRLRLYHHDAQGLASTEVKWDIGNGFVTIPKAFFQSVATPNSIGNPPSGVTAEKSFFAYRDAVGSLFLRDTNHTVGPAILLDLRFKQTLSVLRTHVLTGSDCDTVSDCGPIELVIVRRHEPAANRRVFTQAWLQSAYLDTIANQQEYLQAFPALNQGKPTHLNSPSFPGGASQVNTLGDSISNTTGFQSIADAWLVVPPGLAQLEFRLGSNGASQASALWLGEDYNNMIEIASEVDGVQTGSTFQIPPNLYSATNGWKWIRARLYVHDDGGDHDSRVKWDLGEGLEYIPNAYIQSCTAAQDNTPPGPVTFLTPSSRQYGIQLPDGTVWEPNGPSAPVTQLSIRDTLSRWVTIQTITGIVNCIGQPSPIPANGTDCAALLAADPCNLPPIAVDDDFIVIQGIPKLLNPLWNDTDPNPTDTAILKLTVIGTPPNNGGAQIELPLSEYIMYVPSPTYYGLDSFCYEVQDDGNPALTDIACVHILVDRDIDGDQVGDSEDKDNDNDGISNFLESAYARNFGDTDDDAIPDSLDLDSDNDGIPDIVENGMKDPDSDGRVPLIGDTILMHDINGNGWDDVAEQMDSLRQDTARNSDNDPFPDYLDLDADNDGIYDIIEIGMSGYDSLGVVYPPQLGSDGWDDRGELFPDRYLDNDSIPERLDLDSDNDGIPNLVENRLPDSDNNGMIDGLSDSDLNGADDHRMGGDTIDQDGDDRPNYLDLDADNDGIADLVEDGRPDPDSLGHFVPGFADIVSDGWRDSIIAAGAHDPDLDLLPDFLDLDSDNDGLYDRAEEMALTGVNEGKVTSFQDTLNNGWDKNDDVHGFRDKDGDGVPDRLDLDSDNDGIPDVVEGGGIDSLGIASTIPDGMIDQFVDADTNGADDSRMRIMMLHHDGDLLADYLDLDSDNDGILDFDEDSGLRGRSSGTVAPDPLTDSLGWASSPRLSGRRDADLDTIPDRYDLDSDNDGIYDLAEAMPYALLDTLDNDNDGTLDSLQIEGGLGYDSTLAQSPAIDTDRDSIPDYIDLDSDNDGLADIFEDSRSWLSNVSGQFSNITDGDDNGADDNWMRPTRYDHDGDRVPDFRDLDSDQDGIGDVIEAGYRDVNAKREIPDGMVAGPVNAQGWRDAPLSGNLHQDGDSLPPQLDRDSDDDGIPDLIEANCVFPREEAFIANLLDNDQDGWDDIWAIHAPLDTDLDGKFDFLDTDSDGDGISDLMESRVDAVDLDGNQMIDNSTTVVVGWNWMKGTLEPMNTDSDAIALKMPDYRDLDSDNDGLTDEEELLFDFQGIDCDTNGTPNWRDIFPCNVHFYQGFSPNGDGINDEFVVEGIDYHVQNNVFTVMNRWGVVVYRKEDWEGKWDGRCNVGMISDTTPAPVGIYFYTFQYGAARKEFQKGYIYLRR